MSAIHEDLDGHEGYARQLADGAAPDNRNHERSRFDAYVAACVCGWNGTGRHHPTEDGYEAALDEWDSEHAQPLLAYAVPAHVRQSLSEACRCIRELLDERPDAALKVLGDLDRWRMDMSTRIGEVAPAAVMRARLDRFTLRQRGGQSR